MPELPDITVYLEALESHVLGHNLARVNVLNPFVLRTFDPPIAEASGRRVVSIGRVGKRIVIGLDGDLFIVIHLMIAGRLRWLAAAKAPPKKLALAAFELDNGKLVLTEAGTTRRASISLVRGEAAVREMDRGGVDVFAASVEQFAQRVRSESHTLKRTLTDPRLFDGIGNAYSDEILHRARLSPLMLTGRISDEEIARLYDATREVLREWTERLRAEAAGEFPEKVTAFRPEMAVHGKYGEPCPVCGSPVQRIRYASNETDYCARCQTGGKLLADRAMSRLLKQDWPRSIDDL